MLKPLCYFIYFNYVKQDNTIRIFSADIAYNMGFVVVDYNTLTKKIIIIDSGMVKIKEKTHKTYYLRVRTEELLNKYKPSLVLYEEQFKNIMYMIDGSFSSAVPPTIQINKIFSKRARLLAFNDGSLAKEAAARLALKKYPSLKGKSPDIIDSMVLIMAWKNAIETNTPLKAPKKIKSKKKKKLQT